MPHPDGSGTAEPTSRPIYVTYCSSIRPAVSSGTGPATLNSSSRRKPRTDYLRPAGCASVRVGSDRARRARRSAQPLIVATSAPPNAPVHGLIDADLGTIPTSEQSAL